MKRVLTSLLIVLISTSLTFAQMSKEETFNELAKDLAGLQEMLNQLNEQMKKMTPEERKESCLKLKREIEKNPPDFPIVINCPQ